ncbi:hypothetical protein KKG46_00820 [Patescibacteria group bacterium]|nr:hypothetical protein [Patescibacteria group bacterium]
MTEILINLQKAGFTGTEAKVYISLLELSRAKASDLIKATHMHRNLVYQALDVLIKRHLVTKVIEKSCSVFIANDPVRLLDEYAEKGRDLERLIDDLRTRHKATSREVVIYEGIEGIARATEYALQQTKRGPVYALGSSNVTETSGLIKYWQKYHEERVRRKIWMHLLFSSDTKAEIMRHRNQFAYTEARYLPAGIETPAWFHIVDDIVITEIPSGNNPISVFTKSKELSTTMHSYFNYLWKQTKKIES